jgi:hypothetical protein
MSARQAASYEAAKLLRHALVASALTVTIAPQSTGAAIKRFVEANEVT